MNLLCHVQYRRQCIYYHMAVPRIRNRGPVYPVLTAALMPIQIGPVRNNDSLSQAGYNFSSYQVNK